MAKDRLYSVSYISFFDSELHTTFVITKGDELEALLIGLRKLLSKPIEEMDDSELDEADDETLGSLSGFEGCQTVEEAKTRAFNMDSMVNVERFYRSQAATE